MIYIFVTIINSSMDINKDTDTESYTVFLLLPLNQHTENTVDNTLNNTVNNKKRIKWKNFLIILKQRY